MIKKEYRRTRKLAYPKIKTLWISEILFVNNTRLEMQNRTNNKDEIILLINPITIKGENDTYEKNERNKFGENKPSGFTTDNDKSLNPKLDKKNKKIIKNDDKSKETENIKSKLKLKKKN